MPGCKSCARKWKTCSPLLNYSQCAAHSYITPSEKEIKEWKKNHTC